ncbi:MAG: antibiotic biosynthesis monooxygenase [Planctomycetaceae bacterium]|nr:antibiotic biosynthesis monooxygenase [Planctomycetaceae bacterium]
MATPQRPRLGNLPIPPYYAVIFTSRRSLNSPEEYASIAALMDELVREQPGYLGHTSLRDEAGLGITISYWRDEQSIAAWREHAEHRTAQERGFASFYLEHRVEVCRVERASTFVRTDARIEKDE